MIANSPNLSKREQFEIMMRAQIENSLELGWSPSDIILITNFDFSYNNITAIKHDITILNKNCLTGSKMFAMRWVMDRGLDETYWAHDLDCWQASPFSESPLFKDVGICEYSEPKFNGGAVFWRQSAKDIVGEIVQQIIDKKFDKEEPVLNSVFKTPKYKSRVTILNYTYNLGCSGFRTRFLHAIKPIKVAHLHPTNRIAWEMHALDRYQFGVVAMPQRLENLLRKFYPNLPTKLLESDPENIHRRITPPTIRANEKTKLKPVS